MVAAVRSCGIGSTVVVAVRICLIAVLAAIAVIAVNPVVVVVARVVAVAAVVTALSVAVTCWNDRAASEQGGEDRKNENAFHIGASLRTTGYVTTVVGPTSRVTPKRRGLTSAHRRDVTHSQR
jgi:hypothetical protein